MRLRDRQLIDELAMRYVLGMQRGAARARFTGLLQARFDLRDRVAWWEARLAPLAWSLPQIEPSPLVWQRVRRELGLDARSPVRSEKPQRWLAAAAVFAGLAIVASGGWWRAATQPPEVVTNTVIERVPERVAVTLLSNEDGEALWLARLRPESRRMSVQVVTAPDVRPDNDYQLWLLTPDGTPLSLGLLPQSGAREVALDDTAIAALEGSRMVAVSLEPIGGAPGPLPSGPVLYTAALLAP